jgi:hypothetical protein
MENICTMIPFADYMKRKTIQEYNI